MAMTDKNKKYSPDVQQRFGFVNKYITNWAVFAGVKVSNNTCSTN